MDWRFLIFLFFASLTCGFAAGVLLARNVVRMAFFLILSLGASSGLFFLAGSEFVAAMQLMIYVGGTLVLLIFGVMLTASDSAVSMKASPTDWWLACVPSGALFLLLAGSVLTTPQWNRPVADPSPEAVAQEFDQTARMGLAFLGVRLDDQRDGGGHPSGYLFPFEIVSVHLLVALIGAGYLARTKRRVDQRLPDRLNEATAPSWYAVLTTAVALLAAAKVALYLVAPWAALQIAASLAQTGVVPNAISVELSALPDYWNFPCAAATGLVAVGAGMLRFRVFAGLFAIGLGFVAAAWQFWNFDADRTAAATLVGGAALTAAMLLAFALVPRDRPRRTLQAEAEASS